MKNEQKRSISKRQELHASLERLLELAVQWNCEKHYVAGWIWSDGKDGKHKKSVRYNHYGRPRGPQMLV